MAERLCAGLLHRESEFAVVNGVRLFGTCGPCALASAASNVRGAVVHTGSVYTLMRAAGLCDPSGASTIDALRIAAGKLGIGVAAYRGYGEPWGDFGALFQAHAGYQPFVIEVANGQAFKDAISGDGENATNLQYHFVAVLGRNDGGYSPKAGHDLPAGYWCADGDNFAGGNSNANGFNAADVLQFYPDSVMAAARPCGALVLAKGATAVAWTRNSGGAKDSHGHQVGIGIANEIFAHNWEGSDGLTGEEYFHAKASFAALDNGHVLDWDGTTVHVDRSAWVLADVYNTLRGEADAAKSAEAQTQTALNTAQGDLASAQTQIADLKTQIAKLQSQPAPTPAPQPISLQEALQIVYKAAAGQGA